MPYLRSQGESTAKRGLRSGWQCADRARNFRYSPQLHEQHASLFVNDAVFFTLRYDNLEQAQAVVRRHPCTCGPHQRVHVRGKLLFAIVFRDRDSPLRTLPTLTSRHDAQDVGRGQRFCPPVGCGGTSPEPVGGLPTLSPLSYVCSPDSAPLRTAAQRRFKRKTPLDPMLLRLLREW